MRRQVQLILVGGFLGAGKTTLLARAARRFMDQGKRVGLITNDQAANLVDTGILEREGFGVGEVAGGCFCCRFNDLVGAADRLIEDLQPDVLLGEPVGSCTDLSATVLQPMKELYADWFRVAPFSVLADPARLREALAPEPAGGFPESVLYIFRKQLEEADLIAVNKSDMLSGDELEALRAATAERFPRTPLLTMSALTGAGFDEWFAFMTSEKASGARIAAVDYDTYAEGEAVLGWLNATVQLETSGGRDWRAYADALLAGMRSNLAARGAEIAHLKLLLSTPGGALVANVTASAGAAMVRGEVRGRPAAALLVLNARVHIAPEALREVAEKEVAAALGGDGSATVVTLESFRPGRPQPTHRYSAPV